MGTFCANKLAGVKSFLYDCYTVTRGWNYLRYKARCTKVFPILQFDPFLFEIVPLSDEHFTVVETECDWSGANSWVQWQLD